MTVPPVEEGWMTVQTITRDEMIAKIQRLGQAGRPGEEDRMTKRERAARARLWAAQGVYEQHLGEAQWCNGYRAAGGDTHDMQKKEDGHWQQCDLAQVKCDRALAHLLRVVRQETREAYL